MIRLLSLKFQNSPQYAFRYWLYGMDRNKYSWWRNKSRRMAMGKLGLPSNFRLLKNTTRYKIYHVLYNGFGPNFGPLIHKIILDQTVTWNHWWAWTSVIFQEKVHSLPRKLFCYDPYAVDLSHGCHCYGVESLGGALCYDLWRCYGK